MWCDSVCVISESVLELCYHVDLSIIGLNRSSTFWGMATEWFGFGLAIAPTSSENRDHIYFAMIHSKVYVRKKIIMAIVAMVQDHSPDFTIPSILKLVL